MAAGVVARVSRSIAGAVGSRLLRWSGTDDPAPPGNTREDEPDDRQPEDAAQDGQPPERQPRSTPQNVTTALSLLLIALLVGAIIYDGYASGGSVPASIEVEIRVDEARVEPEGFYIPFEVRNRGDRTIQEVVISFEARDGETVVEEAETVIPLLGERGGIRGTLVLEHDPADLEVEGRVTTFQVAEE